MYLRIEADRNASLWFTRSTATPSFAPTSAASSEYRPPVGTKAATRVVKYLKSASGERPMRKPTSTPERAKKVPTRSR